MSEIVNKIYRNNTIIYKVFLFLIATIAIVYLFPKGGQFKYDFNNGQLWKYDNLYAPFDFAIQKTAEEISLEKKEIKNNAKLYFKYDTNIVEDVKVTFKNKISQLNFSDSLTIDEISELKETGNKIIQKVYNAGFLESVSEARVSSKDQIIALKKENEVQDVLFKNLLTSKNVLEIINTNLGDEPFDYGQKLVLNLLAGVVEPNVSFNKDLTDKIIDNELGHISYTKGKVASDELIILKGDIVAGRKLAILNSLKSEFECKSLDRFKL